MNITDSARVAVMRQYEAAWEYHAIQEQLLRTTDPEGASIHGDMTIMTIRARLAEEDDPAPRPPIIAHCLRCTAAYAP